jgi:hypothetical protein
MPVFSNEGIAVMYPTRRPILVATATVVVVLALFGISAHADVILPTGLAPGFQYEIAFVTSDSMTATSTNIADYNSFVTQEADKNPVLAGLGASWYVMGSTTTVKASANAPTSAGVPIYNTAGQLIIADSSHLWGPNGIDNPIQYDENGTVTSKVNACTGS